jgi:hypothetical protein
MNFYGNIYSVLLDEFYFHSNSSSNGRDWINLAQDRDQQRAFVNTLMNLWVP